MAQDNLYDLIQSLSRSEKRYFTVNGGKEDSNHIRLFKFMSTMKAFDEEKVKKKFPTNLSWEKGNLYKLILKSMRTYQSDKSAYLEIKELLIDAKFLIDRGLFEQSLGLLKKAKKKATTYHRLNDLLEISQLTQMNLLKLNTSGVTKLIEELIEERKHIIKTFEEEVTYSNINSALQAVFLQQITLTTDEDKENFSKKYAFLTSLQDTDIQSNRGQLHYLESRKNLAQLLGQHQETYDFCEKIVGWWEKNPMIKEEENYRYLISLSNLITACSYVNQIERIPKILQQFENQKPQNLMNEIFIFKVLLRYKVLYLMNAGLFREAKNEFLKFEKSLSKFDIDSQWKTTMIINFSILLFILHDFKDCIFWINQILENKNVEKRKKVQQFARLLKCICYLELDDIEGFESAHRSTNGFFSSMNLKKDSFEFTVLKHLKRIESASPDTKKMEQIDLFTFLQKEEKSPSNKLLPGLQECLLWVESKLTGVSITHLYRKKLGSAD